MNDNFEPITFLNLTYLPLEKQERYRPEIYKNMGLFLIQKFLDERNANEIDEIEMRLTEIKDFQSVAILILTYDPSFEQKRENWLNEYKKQFKIENLR